jgi:phage tail-like protein
MPIRIDPVAAYNFEVSLLESDTSFGTALTTVVLSTALGSPIAGFSKCSGLEVTLEIEAYKEGGNNGTILQFPSRASWSKITLERGIALTTELWDWFYGFVEGRGRRRDGVVTLRDANGQPHTVWAFRRGLPARYGGPSLDAMQSAVAIETVEIAHEGLYQIPGVAVIGQAIDAVTGLLR